mgnify:CR=1 FL=1
MVHLASPSCVVTNSRITVNLKAPSGALFIQGDTIRRYGDKPSQQDTLNQPSSANDKKQSADKQRLEPQDLL